MSCGFVQSLLPRKEKYAGSVGRSRSGLCPGDSGISQRGGEHCLQPPRGFVALARFNAGDEVGALAVLDDLARGYRMRRKRKAG